MRRIDRRKGIHQLITQEYVDFLQQNPNEIDLLSALLIVNFFVTQQFGICSKALYCLNLLKIYRMGQYYGHWIPAQQERLIHLR
jgi:hypothetical protein